MTVPSAEWPRSRTKPIDEGGTKPLLPDWHQVSAALRMQIGDRPGDHLVIQLARALAQLHHTRRAQPGRHPEIDRRRGELVCVIDEWVAKQVMPRRPNARTGETLGSTVDRMAAAQILADHLLMTAENVPEQRVHAAWSRLAELANQWTDLAHDIEARRPRSIGLR
ncbi:uncharacterized protein DUF4254 [Nocardia tenerifensis]|uniref:Uncharacterized protein DUF4254 n=1 Tax=Nocardia tenerifensis TaxID=228006 RepID=A0A318JVX7_9NOCA|nr:DUF4254 domain-containing protein [Nocardia tenerifensis]PXX61613.1 uncharacterized protein DUF4254 [Nocardia tenerifensis]